jgi:hypothetical protein
VAHIAGIQTTALGLHRLDVSLSGAANFRGAYASDITELNGRPTLNFSRCIWHAIEVLRLNTSMSPRLTSIYQHALPSRNHCSLPRRAAAMNSTPSLSAISPKGAGCALQLLAIQCSGRVGKSRAARCRALANQSLNRTLHSRPPFTPPFHSGVNAVPLFRAG